MNSHERRANRRLEKAIEDAVLRAVPKSPSSTSTKDGEPQVQPRSWFRRYFESTLSKISLALNVLLVGVTLAGGYSVIRPNVGVEPDLVPDPSDPFSTQFVIKNENPIMGVRDLLVYCTYRLVEGSKGSRLVPSGNPGITAMVPELGPLQETTRDAGCDGPVPQGDGSIQSAYIVIDVSYTIMWHLYGHQQFPMKGVMDSDKKVHWAHITIAELKNTLRQKNFPFLELHRVPR